MAFYLRYLTDPSDHTVNGITNEFDYSDSLFSNIKSIEDRGLFRCFYKYPGWHNNETPKKVGKLGIKFSSLVKCSSSALDSFNFTHIYFPKLTKYSPPLLEGSYFLTWVRFDALKEITGTSKYSSFLGDREGSNYDFDQLKAIVLSSNTLVTLKNSIALIGPPTSTYCPISPSYTGTIEGYIYVPKALIEDYKTATNWSVFEDKFRAIEDYPEICNEGV